MLLLKLQGFLRSLDLFLCQSVERVRGAHHSYSVSRASPACHVRRSNADAFLILLNVEREKRRIPCQDTDLVDFMQVIR
jgi:hypothetical protein